MRQTYDILLRFAGDLHDQAKSRENRPNLLAQLGLLAYFIFAPLQENPQHVLNPIQPLLVPFPPLLVPLQRLSIGPHFLPEVHHFSPDIDHSVLYVVQLRIDMVDSHRLGSNMLVGSGERIDKHANKQRRKHDAAEHPVALPPGEGFFICIHRGDTFDFVRFRELFAQP